MTKCSSARVCVGLLLLLLPPCAVHLLAQTAIVKPATVPAALLSDIHFDPFRDPSKVARLAAVSDEKWGAILSEPNAADQAARYVAMKQTCEVTGDDTDHALLNAALHEAHKYVQATGFVTVSGDLLVHKFECLYHFATKGKDVEPVGAFAAKTANYVMHRVESEFPEIPVYFALGNNDSGCGDYKLSGNDRFLAATSAAVLHGLRHASEAELKAARADYEAGGAYDVAIAGIQHTRLLVVDDVYESGSHEDCPVAAGETAQPAPKADPRMTWLGSHLEAARTSGDKVWVMGHIPPGPDAYNTLKHVLSVCTRPVSMFLTSEVLADELVNNADVVQLAVFAHTHMDELRLLQRGPDKGAVAMKMVPSISPIHENFPAITIAEVDAADGQLRDYAVYIAGDLSGVKSGWKREYRFEQTYHEPSFSAVSLADLTGKLQADTGVAEAETKAYLDYYSAGTHGSPMSFVWPQYACILTKDKAEDFKACICPAQ